MANNKINVLRLVVDNVDSEIEDVKRSISSMEDEIDELMIRLSILQSIKRRALHSRRVESALPHDLPEFLQDGDHNP